MTKNKEDAHPSDPNDDVDHKKIKILGAIPNDITSLNESSSAPKLLPPFNFLANHPSKKSKIEAKRIR